MKRTLIVLTLALVALTACGDDDDADDGADAPATDEAPATDATDAQEPAGSPTVQVSDTSIGEVLVGGDGKTVYLYAQDQGDTSAVPPAVLQAWPPLTVESDDALVAGEGVDESKLGTAAQPDGTLWVTYNGHLLYGFSGDTAPGDTNGHTLGDVWFALTPDGEQAA